MKRLISFFSTHSHILAWRIKLKILGYILRSDDDINATDIVRCYGSCNALLKDLCESDYQDDIMDFAIGSQSMHTRDRVVRSTC